eukprot:PhF_6_TR30154/c0_g1_i1/m.44165/K13356/FAR; alcohol-forming fatty acyl-CoA reductase
MATTAPTSPSQLGGLLPMPEVYHDKVLFLTGITGFVGKVFLYKILKQFPTIRKVYILMRRSKDKTAQQRLESEVLSSRCMEYLKKHLGDEEYLTRCKKCIAVQGDIVQEKLGMTPEIYEEVVRSVHYVVHLAATIDFNERLDESVKLNVLGALRVLALAKKAHTRPKDSDAYPFQCHCHVSTCYVNWNRHGSVVAETLYPLPFPAEPMAKYILSLHPSEVVRITPELLKKYGYPNTYTLTKSLGEHLLTANCGNLPMFIARPSIIGCSWEEPTPGWVDTMSAAGAIFTGFFLGVVHEMWSNGNLIADVVPVDFVVNGILMGLRYHSLGYQQPQVQQQQPTQQTVSNTLAPTPSAAADMVIGSTSLASRLKGRLPVITSHMLTGTVAPPSEGPSEWSTLTASPSYSASANIPVYQLATSATLNTMSWGLARIVMLDYFAKYPSPKAISKCDVYLTPNKLDYMVRYKLKRELPHKVLTAASKVPGLLSAGTKKNVQRYNKVLERNKLLQDNFGNFMLYEWRFDEAKARHALLNTMTAEERQIYNFDAYDIVWTKYLERYYFGLRAFMLKDPNSMPPPEPAVSGSQMLAKSLL